MPFLNLGIVAHVDAGKTSLTERILYDAGAIEAPGSVDAGTTRTDSLELEARRGITIRSGVATFVLGDLTVNLVDTPGHPDFIAEVERSLTVLDAAVLVLSSVEGVQPQSVVIWRALRRLGIPTVVVVNKMDRAGADLDAVVTEVRRRLDPRAVVLSQVCGSGRPDATVTSVPFDDPGVVAQVAEVDDGVLARWAQDEPVPPGVVRRAVRRAVADGSLFPVLAGSAITGAGIPALFDVLATLLPRTDPRADEPASGTVFAVHRDAAVREVYVRMWSGELRVRHRVRLPGRPSDRVTSLHASEPAGPVTRASVRGGEIAVVRGLGSARVGDAFGPVPQRRVHRFAPASLQAVVEPVDPGQASALFAALAELADEDPLIDLRAEADGGVAVSLHGEVQREVVATVLAERYGVRVRFRQTSVVCIERVVGTGHAVELIRAHANPYLATVGLRVAPAPAGHGVEFSPGVERGNLPAAFVAATEEGVHAGLGQGPHGWRVTDCVVTMTQSGYWPRQSRPHQGFDRSISSVAGDFRHLTPVVVAAALSAAGTRVCEPVSRFELDVPSGSLDVVMATLGPLRARVTGSDPAGDRILLAGTMPAGLVPTLTRRLPDLTGGEGALATEPDHYAAVDGAPPRRRRVGPDPADRVTWFRDVPR